MNKQANRKSETTLAPAAMNLAAGGRAIVAASVGNLLEWYDFSVYALFAIYIAANFFPHSDPGLDLVKAFLVFGLGFVVRPLGAILIGIYGDRAGRKACYNPIQIRDLEASCDGSSAATFLPLRPHRHGPLLIVSEHASSCSPGQVTLARILADELRSFGVRDAAVDEHSIVLANDPGTPGLLLRPSPGSRHGYFS